VKRNSGDKQDEETAWPAVDEPVSDIIEYQSVITIITEHRIILAQERTDPPQRNHLYHTEKQRAQTHWPGL
jgi:hypothetical protein